MGSFTTIANALLRLGPGRFASEAAKRGVNSALAALYTRLFGARYYKKRVHDYSLWLDLHDPGVSKQLMIRGNREPEHRYLLRRELKAGMTALDLGANIGYYTVMMAKFVGMQGKVYAVEPYPPSFDLLNRNLRLNGLASVIESYNLGITAATGLGKLYLAEKSNWHTFYPVDVADKPAWARKYARKFSGPIDVKAMSLWDFIQAKRRIDFIRMDIEGYEVQILESFIPHLGDSDFKARILFETHPEFYDDRAHDMERVLRALCRSAGYAVKYVVSDGHLGREAGDFFRRRGYTEEYIVTYFPTCDRAIYQYIPTEDAIECISHSEHVHAALLERKA